MSEKEKKELQLLILLKEQVGKGRPILESLRKVKTEPQKEETEKIFGQFIFDNDPEELTKEIENSRNIIRITYH